MKISKSALLEIAKTIMSKPQCDWTPHDQKMMAMGNKYLKKELKGKKLLAKKFAKLGGSCSCCGEDDPSMLMIIKMPCLDKGHRHTDELRCRNCREVCCPAMGDHRMMKGYRAQLKAVLQNAQSAPLPPIKHHETGLVLEPPKVFRAVEEVGGNLKRRLAWAKKVFKSGAHYKLFDNVPHFRYELVIWKQRGAQITSKFRTFFDYKEAASVFGGLALQTKAMTSGKPFCDLFKEQICKS